MYLINMQQQQQQKQQQQKQQRQQQQEKQGNSISRATAPATTAATAAAAFFIKMQTGSQVVSDRLTCTNTATKKINQSLRWATEIHIMWLLSYSTLITPYPCHQSEERRSSCVYRRSGERGEGKLLPPAFKYGCVSMCMDHYRLCDYIYDHFFFYKTKIIITVH